MAGNYRIDVALALVLAVVVCAKLNLKRGKI